MSEKVDKRAWVPPGVDPKQYVYPMKSKAGCMSRLWQIGVIGFAIYGFVALYQQSGSGGQAAAAQPPTAAPTATLTPYLAATPALGFTIYEFGAEPTAAATERPTSTPIPPGALATWTPGPWLAERWLAEYDRLYSTATPVATVAK